MFVLVGFSLLVALIFLGVFIWAVRSGQYEDKFTPSVRMLFDNDEKRRKNGATDEEQTKEPDIQEHRSKD
jgi:cbb3-type cytochrome oxidase maturation protein